MFRFIDTLTTNIDNGLLLRSAGRINVRELNLIKAEECPEKQPASRYIAGLQSFPGDLKDKDAAAMLVVCWWYKQEELMRNVLPSGTNMAAIYIVLSHC